MISNKCIVIYLKINIVGFVGHKNNGFRFSKQIFKTQNIKSESYNTPTDSFKIKPEVIMSSCPFLNKHKLHFCLLEKILTEVRKK